MACLTETTALPVGSCLKVYASPGIHATEMQMATVLLVQQLSLVPVDDMWGLQLSQWGHACLSGRL